jgi:hypothetical protein
MNGRISMRSAVSGLLEHFPLQRRTYSSLRTTRPQTRAYRKLPFLGVFLVRVDQDASFRMQSHGLASELDLFWRGLYVHEAASMRLWVQLCRRSEVVFDVGANIGLYALAAAASNPKADVFAFESLKYLHTMLIWNAELNGWRLETRSAPRMCSFRRSVRQVRRLRDGRCRSNRFRSPPLRGSSATKGSNESIC